MCQPTTGRKSFEEETEFSLNMIQGKLSSLQTEMTSLRCTVEGLKAVVISCCFVTFFLAIVVVFTRC